MVLYHSDNEMELVSLEDSLPEKQIDGRTVYMTFVVDARNVLGGLYFDNI